MSKQRWVRGKGDFLAFSGPCLLTHVIVYPDAADDYADVYDGRDATVGSKLARFRCADKGTRQFDFGDGILMDGGIYVAAFDSAVETTIAFIPVESQPASLAAGE
uniref:Uncharacterized protein n=1 Tax=viral metagenome TaxID=1070528 RepID=A0A6H1ZUQ4_9ZZZZ